MLNASYTSVPEIRTPARTLVIVSVMTLGLAFLLWRYKKHTKKEDENRTL
jgi:hypothetical protein